MIDEYEYSELFEDHETVHLIIVNSSATVTGVANDEPTIEDADFVITEDDVDEDSLDLRESLNSGDNLKFGSMNSSCFQIDIFHRSTIPSLKDDEIAVYMYFDDDSSTLFQIGVYIVKTDEYSDDRLTRHITSYDNLNNLQSYDITAWYNSVYEGVSTVTIKDLRDGLFTWLNTPTAQGGEAYEYTISQEETELVNDDFEVEKSIESDVVTFGFFMSGLLEANGVFGHIDRTGVFRYISLQSYDQTAKRVITDEDSLSPTIYEDYHVWGIGYVAIWDRNNLRLAYEGSSAYRHPSVYNIINSFVFVNNTGRSNWLEDVKEAAQNIRNNITHMWYYPFQSDVGGNLCYEVGDRVDIIEETYDEETDSVDDEEPIIKNLYSYILERRFFGLQEFTDTYSAKGDRKQPKYKLETSSNWHEGDSGSSGSVDGNDGTGEVVDDDATKFIKYCRNIGIRLLQEPSVSVEYVRTSESHQVEITWTDPSDITNYKPVPCEWAGTIVVRSENRPPVHPWDDCEILVNSTTRDEYSETPFVDNTIEENKKYYYGIFPYHIALDDADHPIKYYRFTKVISVNTQRLTLAPLIVSHSVSGSDVTLTIEIPTLDDGSYSYVKAVAKKNSIPASKTDGTVIDLSATATSVTFSGLDEQSHYYFVIFANDGGSDIASDPDDCTTGRNEGYNFAYTGSIQTFTAPKTGIYQLETWGAQGGNATDNDLVARGGYGAYAKGEVFLAQGDTLYINVGGQNGYGGGGALPTNLSKIMYLGNATNLAQVSDFSIITNEIKNATTFTKVRPSFYDTSELVSYLSSAGDIFYYQDRDIVLTDENTYKLIDNDYIEVGFGKSPYLYSGQQYYGAYVYNKVTQSLGNIYGFKQSDVTYQYNFTRKYYVGVIMDMANARGYLLFGSDLRNLSGSNGWLVDLWGGVVNGVDYIYESFKDKEV